MTRQADSATPPLTSIRILQRRVDRVSFAQAIQRIQHFLHDHRPHQIVTANTLMLLAAEHDPDLAAIIDEAALVVPESSGVRWASRRLQEPLDEIIPGIDLFQALCHLARDLSRRIFLLGAKPGVAESAGAELQKRYPGLLVAGTHHGFFAAAEAPEVVERVRQADPDFLFVGMSVPAQEKWIARHLHDLRVPVVMGVGGSLDVLSGKLKRAPFVFRRFGMEWAYRTMQEPWRLERIRMLPVFMWKIVASRGDLDDKPT